MELNKRLILILTMGIMAIGLITYRIDADGTAKKSNVTVSDGQGNDANLPSVTPEDTAVSDKSDSAGMIPDTGINTASDDETINSTASASEAEEPSPTPEPNPLKCEVYPDIHTLIEQYFQARLSCNIEDFEKIVTDIDYINIETITRATESVRDYTDCTVYTKRGYGNIDLVAYCTFNMIVPKVDSPVASMEVFYIVYDDEGNPRIFSGVLENDVYDKLIAMDNDPEVLALKNYVETEIQHAMEKDESLQEFWNKMMNHITIDDVGQDNSTSGE